MYNGVLLDMEEVQKRHRFLTFRSKGPRENNSCNLILSTSIQQNSLPKQLITLVLYMVTFKVIINLTYFWSHKYGRSTILDLSLQRAACISLISLGYLNLILCINFSCLSLHFIFLPAFTLTKTHDVVHIMSSHYECRS